MGGQGGCERSFCENSKKKIFFFGGGGGGWGVSGRGRVGGGWVRVDVNEIEVFVKIQKKKFFFGGGAGRWGGRGRVGGQSRCERRIEVFVKIQKKNLGGGVGWGVGGGVRVDVNKELKFL